MSMAPPLPPASLATRSSSNRRDPLSHARVVRPASVSTPSTTPSLPPPPIHGSTMTTTGLGPVSKASGTATASTSAVPAPRAAHRQLDGSAASLTAPDSPLASHPYFTHAASLSGKAAGLGGTPVRPHGRGHRVTHSVGCFPVSPVGDFAVESPRPPQREPVLPTNPAIWTPSELAQHLAWSLRTGGADGTGPTLPSPVVEDVVTWVLRSRIAGKQFTRGIDGWSGNRPPPFLPVLAQMSRRLRRTVRGRRASNSFSEADAVDEDDEDSDGVTRVKRLANAFDAITSASEASDSEPTLSFLRAQLTGDSVEGFGRVTPKTNDTPVWGRRARRDSTASAVSTMSAASGMSTASGPIWCDSRDSAASAAGIPACSRRESTMSDVTMDEAMDTVPDSPSLPLAKKKAELEGKRVSETETSPPPPYHSDAGPPSPTRTGLLFPSAAGTAPGTPENIGSRSASVTPLHGGEIEIEESDHLTRMAAHRAAGVNPYAALRREKGRPSLPSVSIRAEDPEDDDDDDDPWPSLRKVTARPLAVDALAPRSPATPANVAGMRVPSTRSVSRSVPSSRRRREREREMEKEMAVLTDRIRELEERLAAVETPTPIPTPPLLVTPTPASPIKTPVTPEAPITVITDVSMIAAHICPTCNSPTHSASNSRPHSPAPAPDLTPAERKRSWLRSFDLVDDEGDRPRLLEMPIYLFLMGMGVGVGFSAVVVRMLFAKARA